nr:reverse transcriptase domain-containing protein [Tanacetum cinerariifolium]
MEPLSESEDSGGGHWKSRSKKQKSSIEEDDMSQPWVCEETEPFTSQIRYFDFPKENQMLNNVKTYDGSDDSKDHLKIFQAAAKVERWAMPTWCHMFNSTLTGSAMAPSGSKEPNGSSYHTPRWFQRRNIWPMGQILMPIKIGDTKHSASTWMNFLVVRSPSPYNGIIRRPGVRKIQAVPSTAHEMLKFLVPGGILTLRSSRIIPLECMMVSGPEAQFSSITQVAEELIKVAIHLKYLDQTISIGSTLTEEGRRALCELLRRNLDIFSWKPEDMTGVSRYLAEHRLNVREGCLPVRQKKRSQAPKRNKAIQEEVSKLVDAKIIKEVYYHSWLSNHVMVKKHDDSWRICVDFKDLNKTCPKDV